MLPTARTRASSTRNFAVDRPHRSLLGLHRTQSAVSCSTLRERAAWSSPSASQVSCPWNILEIGEQYQKSMLTYYFKFTRRRYRITVGAGPVSVSWVRGPLKNWYIHISASLSRQPLVKGERSVRYEVNAAMPMLLWLYSIQFQKS